MKFWGRFLVLAILGFALGAAFALFQGAAQERLNPPFATVAAKKTETVPVAGVQVGGPFSLIDHKGNVVTEKSWPGKYKLVFFGFTHCPDTCPATLQKIAVVMDHFDPQGEKIVPLFITVDPESDTPQVMAKYVGAYNPHIVGLTGTEAQIKSVEDAYKVYAMKNEDAVDHSAYIYLMSPDGRLLETFGLDETAENMIAKLAKDSVK